MAATNPPPTPSIASGHHGPVGRHDPTGHHAAALRLTVATFTLGVLALALGFAPSLHGLGTAVGIAGVGTGLWSQMASESTDQRWFDITGLVAAAVGLFLSLMNGGLYGVF